MLFGSSAMKHIKYLEEEKQCCYRRNNNSTTVEVDRCKRSWSVIIFKQQGKYKRIDMKICKLRISLNVFNTHTEIEEGLTIDTALIKLAQ